MKLLPLLLFATATVAMAAPRDLSQARQAAAERLSSLLGHEAILTNQPQLAAQRPGSDPNSQQLPYYLFSDTDNQAFVFIAGSDLLPAVIGYGQADNLKADELPDNLVSWLDAVAKAEAYLEANPAAAQAEAEALRLAANVTTPVIKPLMKCRWGQGYPFNEKCPVKGRERAVVGCVATAMSQVLYTNKFPAQSIGKVTYPDYGNNHTVNLGGVSYDYSIMRDAYTRQASSSSIAEVAKLCYNVGSACMMQYGVDGSGTSTVLVEKAAAENFGCTRAQHLDRQYYGLDEWNDILQQQLAAGNPVIYGGQSEEGGHSFVLDGLDEQGFYHVNWGWEGAYNGYFDVCILRSDGTGTGAVLNNGYSYNQGAVVNVCDPKKAVGYFNVLNTLYTKENQSRDKIKCSGTPAPGATVTLSCTIANLNPCNASGLVGAVLMQGDEEIDRQTNSQKVSLDGTEYDISNDGGLWYSYSYDDISMDYKLPADLEDGKYQLWLCLKNSDTGEWDMVRQSHLSPSYWTLTVSNGDYKLTHDVYGIPVTVDHWKTDPSPMAASTCTISCDVTSTADESFPLHFTLDLTYSDGSSIKDIPCGNIYNEAITLAPNETQQIDFKVNLPKTGDWTATLFARQQGHDEAKPICIAITNFGVESDKTKSAQLSLLEKPKVKSKPVENDSDVTFEVKLSNAGDAYDGKMCIRLFKSSTSVADNALVAEIGAQDVKVDAHKISATYEISGHLNIDGLTQETSYYARVFFLYGDQMTLLEPAFGVNNKLTVIVTPSQETALAEITRDEPTFTPETFTPADQIYNLLGKRVSLPSDGRLRPGIYIINGKKRVIR